MENCCTPSLLGLEFIIQIHGGSRATYPSSSRNQNHTRLSIHHQSILNQRSWDLTRQILSMAAGSCRFALTKLRETNPIAHASRFLERTQTSPRATLTSIMPPSPIVSINSHGSSIVIPVALTNSRPLHIWVLQMSGINSCRWPQ